jgi:hypothetical protein
MATPAKKNFKIKTNSYWSQVWQIKSDGIAVDITNYDFKIEIKNAPGIKNPDVLALTLGAGITIVDAPTGKIKVEIQPQTQIMNTTTYVYDLLVTINGTPYNWMEGQITFDPGVTFD